MIKLKASSAFEVSVGWRREYVGVKRLSWKVSTSTLSTISIISSWGHVYGDFDDGERFAHFQLAAVELMERRDFILDVLHVHVITTAMHSFFG